MGDNRGREDSKLRVFSWNVGGLRAQHMQNYGGSRFSFFQRVLRLRRFPHIVAIQETHLTSRDMLENWEKNLYYYKCYFTYGEVRTCGTALLIRKDVPLKIDFINHGREGRFTMIKGELEGNIVTLVSIYAPLTKKKKEEFFEEIIQQNLEGLIYLMGDFNSIADRKKDAEPIRKFNDSEFVEFMQQGNFTDVWRENNPNREGVFSCRSGQNLERGSRIDYILASRVAKITISDIKYIYCGLSDHHAMEFEVIFDEVLWGRDFKKFKPSIFKDAEYENMFKRLWEKEIEGFRKKVKQKIREGTFVGDAADATIMINGNYTIWDLELILPNLELDYIWWDDFKNKIKKSAIQWLKMFGNNKRKYLEYLIYLYQTTYSQEARRKIEIDMANEIKRLNREILFESHCEERLYNEKCSAPFFRKMRKKRDESFIFEYQKENGQITEDKDEIKREMKNSYENLYRYSPMVNTYVGKFLNNILYDLPQVENFNDGILLYDELEDALKDTKAEKCPGLDGIPIDFYKKYFHMFGKFFTKMANNCFENDSIPESWKTSLLKLIPKTENEIPSFKNMRPLTMINVDAKLITKVFGKRMGDVIPGIIGDRQTGGVRGRQVQKNTQLINFFIWHLYEQHKNGFVTSLDNQKAFDSVKRDYLWLVLEKFGFSTKFINMLKLMYNENTAVLSINGFFTESFAVERGVKQGCSMSPILYTLFIEPLAIAIEQEDEINGLIAPNKRVLKILQHSDDMTIFTPNTFSLGWALNIIEEYKDLSGAKINYDKSFIIQINSENSRRLSSFRQIKVCKKYEFRKILGIFYGSQPKLAKEYNWDQSYKKCKKEINMWKARELSLVGKILLLNTVIISKLNYLLESLGSQKQYVEDFRALFDKFLWPAAGETGKAVKIKQEALTWPKNQGGLNLVDINDKKNSLYFKWYRKFTERNYQNQEEKDSFLMDFNLSFIIYYIERAYRARISNNLVLIPEINYAYCEKNIHQIVTSNWPFAEIFHIFRRFNFLIKKYPKLEKSNTKVAYIVLSQQRCLDERVWSSQYHLNRYPREHNLNITVKEHESLVQQIYLPCLDPKIQSFNFEVLWNILPTNTRMQAQKTNKGRIKLCSYCRYFNERIEEDWSHIFRYCEVAETVWNRVNLALRKIGDPGISMDWKVLVFKWFLPPQKVLLISEVLFAIWKNRNTNKHQNQHQGPFVVLKKIKYKLNLLSAIDRRSMQHNKYDAFWSDLNKFLGELKTQP